MAYTHLAAKELYKAGKEDAAWKIAQQDEGWISETTRSGWENWMKNIIRQDEEQDAANKAIY